MQDGHFDAAGQGTDQQFDGSQDLGPPGYQHLYNNDANFELGMPQGDVTMSEDVPGPQTNHDNRFFEDLRTYEMNPVGRNHGQGATVRGPLACPPIRNVSTIHTCY